MIKPGLYMATKGDKKIIVDVRKSNHGHTYVILGRIAAPSEFKGFAFNPMNPKPKEK